MVEMIKKLIKKFMPNCVLHHYKQRKFLRIIMNGFDLKKLRPLNADEHKKMQEINKQYKRVKICFLSVNVISTFCAMFSHFYDRVRKKDDCYCLLLRQFSTGGRKYIVPNQVLDTMFCRTFQEINSQNANFWCTYLKNYPSHVELYLPGDEYEFQLTFSKLFYFTEERKYKARSKARVEFTEEEKSRGSNEMDKLGIKGGYACFFSRDNAYYQKHFHKDVLEKDILSLFQEYRNSDIQQYCKLTKYLAQQGMQSVRVGENVVQAYQGIGSIDYSNLGQCAFMDVFLMGNCQFFVGDVSGIIEIPRLFFRPVIFINVSLILNKGDSMAEADLMIFRQFHRKGKRLKLKEILQLQQNVVKMYPEGNAAVNFWRHLQKNHIIAVPNTAQEICEVAQEMLAILDGTIQYSEEDITLQARYQKRVAAAWPEKGATAICARVGAKWLRDNTWFLEE